MYFLLEKLHEKIQLIINNSLKSLLAKWKSYNNSLSPMYDKAVQSKEEDEEEFVAKLEEGLYGYTSEMQKCSNKTEALCRLLSNKDQVSQESFESALAKGGLANLFDKYWESQATIIDKSIRNYKDSLDKTSERIYNSFVIRYPLFASRLLLVWSKLIHECGYFDVEYHISLKNKLLNSIQLLKKDYLDGVKGNIDKCVSDIKDGFTSLEKASSNNVFAYQSQKINKNLAQIIKYIQYYYFDTNDIEQISIDVNQWISKSLYDIIKCIESTNKAELQDQSKLMLWKQLSVPRLKDEPYMVDILSKIRPQPIVNK